MGVGAGAGVVADGSIENGNEKFKIIMQEGAVISLDFKILLPFDEIL